MSRYAEILDSELHAFQIQLAADRRQLLVRYCDELDRWNLKINLTGLRGPELVRRLVVEPAWVAEQVGLSGRIADIGSGNGSPAIPMHIVRRFTKCELVESRAKRAAFLRHTAGILKLPGVSVHCGRFEQIAETMDSVDWVTLQGVSLNEQLLRSIRLIALPTTTIVWLTSGARPPIAPIRRLEIPVTRTEVLLFQLDQS